MKDILPDYITRFQFDQSALADLMSGGDITENLDSTGNQIIKSGGSTVTECLINIKQTKVGVSQSKVDQYYDTNFTEFITNVPSKDNPTLLITDDLNKISDDQYRRESILEDQLDELSKVLDIETHRNIKIQEDAEQNYKATKNLIIEMRIKNGEGRSESDFMDSFPFLPHPDNNKPDVSYNPSPYVIEPT